MHEYFEQNGDDGEGGDVDQHRTINQQPYTKTY